jgi:hypothetical protein
MDAPGRSGVTVIPIGQYLTQFSKGIELEAAETRRDEAMQLPSFDPKAEEDLVRRLEEAQAQGREEGRAAAAAEFELELAKERGQIDERIASERDAWLAEEGRRMGEAVEAALQVLETKIADSVARILEPFLGAAQREKMLAELAKTLSALLADEQPLLKISGPESLLAALREKLGTTRGAIEYLPSDSTDISAVADHLVIETRLQAWIDRFHQAIEG